VTTTEAIKLLEKFRAGGVSRDEVLRKFQAAPVADLGFAQVDTHRALRRGFPEVIFGAGKTPDQVVKIAAKLFAREQRVLVTRIAPEAVRRLLDRLPGEFPEACCDTQDGVRLDWPEGWVHVRPSNTEPIYRTIGESTDAAWVAAKLDRIDALARQLMK